MITIQELDSILNYIGPTTVWSELRKKFSQIDREELRIILRKYRKDGYVDLLNNGINLRAWDDESGYNDDMVIQKNYEGYLFCQDGGYSSKQIRENEQGIRLKNLESMQQKLASKLNTLTGWIAGGTIALVIVELIKFTYEIMENH